MYNEVRFSRVERPGSSRASEAPDAQRKKAKEGSSHEDLCFNTGSDVDDCRGFNRVLIDEPRQTVVGEGYPSPKGSGRSPA